MGIGGCEWGHKMGNKGDTETVSINRDFCDVFYSQNVSTCEFPILLFISLRENKQGHIQSGGKDWTNNSLNSHLSPQTPHYRWVGLSPHLPQLAPFPLPFSDIPRNSGESGEKKEKVKRLLPLEKGIVNDDKKGSCQIPIS